MHILEIPSFFPPYGGLFCLDQAKALLLQGHEVRILSNVQMGLTIGLKDYLCLPYKRFEHTVDGVTVIQSYQRGLPKVVRYNVERWVAIVRSMFRDYVEKYGRPDIMHAHCAKWAGYAAMLISDEYQIPYVMMKFAWTGDGPWRALEEGVRIQARRKGRAWTGNGPWRAVECRCFVHANLINAATPAGIGGQRRGGEVGG